MITLNIIDTLSREFKDFFGSVKNIFIDFISSIYNFLTKYIPESLVIMFGIALLAFLIILVFRYVITKR